MEPKPEMPVYKFAEQLVEIDGGKTLYLYAFCPGELVPSATCMLDLDGPAGWIMSVWVEPAHRRRGLAGSLVARCQVKARDAGKESVGLTVADNNPNAERIYRAAGFRTYLKNGTDGKQMVKIL